MSMENILRDSKFQKKLVLIAEENGDSFEDVYAKAAEYMKELYTQHSPVANVMGMEFSQYILSRGYKKTIDVNPTEMKQLSHLARQHPIAFVMTHKTYIDMMVLAVVLTQHGVPLPYTFAGINMAFMGLNQMGRQNGVIFIRRSFKENEIYKTTLRHFIASLVNDNAHFMWAIEGTRSRTGKLVWPKVGILKYIKEAEEQSFQEIKYVPVSIVYDLIPDVKDITLQWRRNKKTPESLMWFMNYIKKMGNNFGKISLRFGEPVVVNDDNSVAIITEGHDVKGYSGKLPRFALELVHKINEITPVTTSSLICIALLSKFSLNKIAIENDVIRLMELIEKRNPDALVDRGKPIGESVQTALNLLIRAKLILQHGDILHAKYVIISENYLQATYYANMSVHHLYQRAFIELALLESSKAKSGLRAEIFWSEIMELRKLFKFEFFYSKKSQFSDELESNLEVLDENWEKLIRQTKSDAISFLEKQNVIVAPVVLHSYVEAYRVVVYALQNMRPRRVFDEENFINDCLFVSEEMHWQGRVQRIESVSKPFLINGIRLAKNLGLIPTPDDNKKDAIQKFLNQLNDVSERIKTLQALTLTKSAETTKLVPIERDIVPGSKIDAFTRPVMEGEGGAHIGAFFDLDRTLIKGFSAKEFFQTKVLSGRITAREVVAQFAGVMVYAMGNGNFAGLAAMGAQGVKGVDERTFIEVGEDVYHQHLADEIYPEARALVAAHLAKGHTVAIISAATPYQVNPIAHDLNIEHVMCTVMEVKDGKFTGNIVEPACWGEGKAHAAKELTKKYNLDLTKSFFYTDSAEDLPLLEIVGNPRPMNPDTKLSALAYQNDWTVYRLNDEKRPGLSNIVRTGLALGSLVPAVINGVASGAFNMSWADGVNSMMATVGDLVVKMAGLELAVKGEEYLWGKRPAVFILNHQSSVDMFVAAKLIRKDAVGIAKKELKSMPIIGQLLQAGGVIFIDRKDKEKAIEAMKPAVNALQNNTSIIIFPEGTRSKDKTLGSFKKGAFHLAMQAGVPIIPIVLRNAADAMPKGGALFRATAIEIKVLPPVSTKRWTKMNMDRNIEKIRNEFLSELGQRVPKEKLPKVKSNGKKVKLKPREK
jgi:putative phosphoserine phosphatase/1-acylglycerol-3-phosphate O-acyltransferase